MTDSPAIRGPDRGATTDGDLDWGLVIDALPDLVLVLAPDHRVLAANKAALRALCLREDEVVGRSCHELFTEGGRSPGACPLPLVDDDRRGRIETECRMLGGIYRVRAIAVTDSSGRLVRSIYLARDATADRQTERNLRDRISLGDLGARIGRVLAAGDSLDAMLQSCAQALVDYLEAAFARIWLYDEREEVLVLRASAGLYTHLDGGHCRIPLGQLKIGTIAHSRKPHLTNAVIGDPSVHDQAWAEREGMVAFAGHPLVVGDRLVGVMGMFSRRTFSEVTANALASVADEIAIGIEGQQTDERLRRVNRALRTLSEGNQVLMRSENDQQLFDDLCRVVVEVGGYQAAWIGMAADDPERSVRPVAQTGCDPGYLAAARISWGDNERGQGPTGTAIRTRSPAICQNIMNDPRYEPWRQAAVSLGYAASAALPLIVDGRPVGSLNLYAVEPDAFDEEEQRLLEDLVEDVAFGLKALWLREEYQRAAEGLRASEEKYRSLVENAADSICLVDLEGHILEGNRRFEELFGYSPDEPAGLAIAMLYPPEALPRAMAAFDRVVCEGSMAIHDIEILRRDGGQVPVDITASLIEYGGKQVVLGILRDISERKQTAAELNRREHEWANAMDFIEDAVYLVGLDDRVRQANRQFYALIGLTPEETIGHDIKAIIHPEGEALPCPVCRARMERRDAMIVMERDHPDNPCNRPIQVVLKVIRDRLGEPLSILMGIRDLTPVENLRRQAQILEQIHEAVIATDFDGMITSWNRGAAAMFGLAAEQAVGRPLAGFLPGAETASLQGRLSKEDDGRGVARELRIERPDGEPFDALVRLGSFKNAAGTIRGYLYTLQDITESRRARQALEERERLYRLLVETVPFGIQENDTEGIITFGNERLHSIMGCGPGELIGKPIWHLVANRAEQEQLRRYLALLVTEQPAPTPYYAKDRTADGRLIDVQVDWNYKHDAAGNLVGFISVISDITERRQLEAQLRQAQKMEAIGTLAGGIAHDFNNILFPILGFTQLALTDLKGGGDVSHYLEEVLNAGNRAKELVSQILTFSRHGEQERQPLLLVPVVKEALKLIRATLPATIEIRQRIDAACGPVLADPTQIHQVLMNLCTNAYHAMRKKGGLIEISLQEKEVDAEEAAALAEVTAGRYVRLSVRDTGHGMEPQVLERIFEPYYSTKGKEGGTGLGLAIVYGIVQSYDGAITVTSEPGRGSVFDVYLPLAEQRHVEGEVIEKAGPPGGSERLMVVDDEEAIVRLLDRMLGRLGYRVTSFASSLEALKAFQQEPEAYDLVITDMTMPQLAGTELARQLIELRPDTPVILCTGFSELISEERVAAIGIRKLAMKPLVLDDLAEAVREVLDGRAEPVGRRPWPG